MPRTFTCALLPAGQPVARSRVDDQGSGVGPHGEGRLRDTAGRVASDAQRRADEDLGAVGPDTSAGAAGEQVVVEGGSPGERLVAALLEQDDGPVVLVPHDDAGTPLGVLDRGVHRERVVVVLDPLLGRRPRAAGVAVAARLLQLLAEVAEQELPPAAGGL